MWPLSSWLFFRSLKTYPPFIVFVILHENKGVDENPSRVLVIFCIGFSSDVLFRRHHVFTDLRPYICTIRECVRPNFLYSRRKDWISHQADHGSLGADSKCPLCAKKLTVSSTFYEHVANHLEQLALFLLPDRECESEEEKESDHSDSKEFKTWIAETESISYNFLAQNLVRVLPLQTEYHVGQLTSHNGVMGCWITTDCPLQAEIVVGDLLRYRATDQSEGSGNSSVNPPENPNLAQERQASPGQIEHNFQLIRGLSSANDHGLELHPAWNLSENGDELKIDSPNRCPWELPTTPLQPPFLEFPNVANEGLRYWTNPDPTSNGDVLKLPPEFPPFVE
jgi:hypothetical protein